MPFSQNWPAGWPWQRAIDGIRPGRNLSRMKASPIKPAMQKQQSESRPAESATSDDAIDLSLLEESLAKTVWERMLANDDALRLADLLQAAMLKTRAKPSSLPQFRPLCPGLIDRNGPPQSQEVKPAFGYWAPIDAGQRLGV